MPCELIAPAPRGRPRRSRTRPARPTRCARRWRRRRWRARAIRRRCRPTRREGSSVSLPRVISEPRFGAQNSTSPISPRGIGSEDAETPGGGGGGSGLFQAARSLLRRRRAARRRECEPRTSARTASAGSDQGRPVTSGCPPWTSARATWSSERRLAGGLTCRTSCCTKVMGMAVAQRRVPGGREGQADRRREAAAVRGERCVGLREPQRERRHFPVASAARACWTWRRCALRRSRVGRALASSAAGRGRVGGARRTPTSTEPACARVQRFRARAPRT